MRSVVVFLGILLAAPAGALEEPMIQRAQAPGHNPIECYCRAQGRMFAQGEKVCLKTADGPRIARCDMAINVTTWSITETPCPET